MIFGFEVDKIRWMRKLMKTKRKNTKSRRTKFIKKDYQTADEA